jgi:hypothetical protein
MMNMDEAPVSAIAWVDAIFTALRYCGIAVSTMVCGCAAIDRKILFG